MAFPTGAAENTVHDEQGISYFMKSGNWRRLDELSTVKYSAQNFTDAIFINAHRPARTKIVLEGQYRPSGITNMRGYFRTWDDANVTFSAGNIVRYGCLVRYGNGGIMHQDLKATGAPNARGFTLNPNYSDYHPKGVKHQVLRLVAMNVPGGVFFKWTMRETSSNDTPMTVDGIMLYSGLTVPQIKSTGISFDQGSMNIKDADLTVESW